MLFCPIRREWVADRPEEQVRLRFLSYLIEVLGFPPSLITVEKALRHLPFLTAESRSQVPDRRADILCFGQTPKKELFPLLLVECKAVKLTSRARNQVGGYNHYVGAPYFALVNDDELCVGWFDKSKNGYEYRKDLPQYKDLLASTHGSK